MKKTMLLIISVILATIGIVFVSSCNNVTTPEETSAISAETTFDAETTLAETSGESTTAVYEETSAKESAIPESVELEDGYTLLFDASALKNGKMPVGASSELIEGDTSYISYKAANSDPYVFLFSKKITQIGRYVKIKYRTSAGPYGQIYMGVDEINDCGMQRINYISDGQWHIATIDLLNNDAFSGSVCKFFRFDMLDGQDVFGKTIDVEWIAFYPNDGASYTKSLSAREPSGDMPNISAYTQLGNAYYTASGYTSSDGNTFTFTSEFEMNVYYRTDNFNRYTIKYSSSSPIEGKLTYLVDNGSSVSEKTETFFLEAGTDMSFSSLIDGYFDAEYAYGISKVTMETCDNSTASFTILGFDSNVIPVYGAGTYFIENEHFRVGILLKWGGGVSYIEDLIDGDNKLSNLINHCDTGRLIQQSYYGTSDSSVYECGKYNGTTWGYNPVQGGDQYGNASKIVDIAVSGDGMSVYVKARPMDWAKNNSACPAYMENTYTLLDDAIKVDNRFVDFFGTSHPSRHQELPAFYTISYLGIFNYYNGTEPWTGGDYETLPNEEFWGGRGSAYHEIKNGNTETWAAWTAKNGYGIGLYVPDTEIMLAGRNAYNGSRSDTDGATNYVAPLRTMRIVDFEPYEYSYYISAGTIDQMRSTFQAYANN